jgi:biopolymer transport protein ExbB
MNRYLLLPLLIVYALSAKPVVDKNAQALKEKEYETLKMYLEAARDSLQNEIAARWRARQFQVKQQETDKEELTTHREKIERAHMELARLKEENFSKSGIIDEKNRAKAAKHEEWKFIEIALDELYEKDAETVLESFPLDMEDRKLDLETIRRSLKRSGNASTAYTQYLDYKKKYLLRGSSVSLNKQTILTDAGDVQELNYARFGNLFIYGLNSSGDAYTIRQTGSYGADRYSVDKLGISPLNDFVQTSLPLWIERQQVSGPLMMDILQNSQSRILISGEKITSRDAFIRWFKAGGPVMIPLFLLLIWAISITVWKMIQFMMKRGGNKKLSKVVFGCLGNNDIEGARAFAAKRKGVVARVVRTCLEHSQWNRTSAEKAVKEMLIEELPSINKHLNTLAVLAGAAPLLGLLGTVTGMINLFEVITNYGTGDPKMLAGGISEALITTEVGLIIAIPILLIHNFLRNRTNDLQSEMEKYAIRILNRLWPKD